MISILCFNQFIDYPGRGSIKSHLRKFFHKIFFRKPTQVPTPLGSSILSVLLSSNSEIV